MNFSEKKPALILIDVQKAFLDEDYWGGNRNNKNAEAVCGKLLAKWREAGLPVFFVRHASKNPASPLAPGNPGFAFNDHVTPREGEPVVTKNVNSAFIGTDLQSRLDALRIKTLVVAGLITNFCVSTTVRMAGNLGYETYVIEDAAATFDRVGIRGEKYDSELVHLTSLASLKDEFATVWDSERLIREF
ncbi:MAG: cysteine hydrolase [Fusobacteriaceae bacterium]|jgi:nicotinamidase-related amidase|nr:cysteine hydrolase [Fusobacteriaceae bacterium]